LDPTIYFKENEPGMTNGTMYHVPFQPEVGAAGFPRMRGLKKMGIADVPHPSEFDGDVADSWKYHKFEGLSYRLNGTAENYPLFDPIYNYGGDLSTLEEYVG